MKENNKGNKLISLPMVVLLILGIGWHIFNYYKSNKKTNTVESPSSSIIIEENSSIKNDFLGEKIDFPHAYDYDVDALYYQELTNFYEMLDAKDFRTNYKNLKKEKSNGKKYVYNCDRYLSKYSFCTETSLTVDGKMYKSVLLEEDNYKLIDLYANLNSINDETINDAIEEFKDSYGYNRYYKIGRYYIWINFFSEKRDLNSVTIYDGINEVYAAENVIKTRYYLTENSGDSQDVSPIIVNNVLHFVEQGRVYGNTDLTKNSMVNSYGKLKYNTIDLTKDKMEVKLVKEFNGYFYSEK